MNVEEKSTEQKNVKLIFAKQQLIRKLKFRVFDSMADIFYFLFRMLSYFRVILQPLILHFSKT